ncbi:MAG: hypothetical protein ACOCYB_11430 [Alkalispirochaeta sp.]
MLEISLHHRITPEGALILSLGMAFRIVFAVPAAVVALGIVSAGSIPIAPTVVLVVMVGGALYQERWVLNPTNRTITATHGLVFWSRTRRWSYDDIVAVRYAHYRAAPVPGDTLEASTAGVRPSGTTEVRRGGQPDRRLRRHFLTYGLVTHDGQHIRIETRRVTNWDADFMLPQSVATALSVPLQDAS